jgi:signal transduction histidine kinase
MAADHILTPYAWRRQLSLLRPMLGAGCFAAALLLAPQRPLWALLALVGCYTVYALLTAVWPRLEQAAYGTITLLLDTGLFLGVASLPPSPMVWLSLAAYVFALGVAFLVHDWKKVWLVAAVALVYLLVMHPPQAEMLWPTVLVTGIFACVAAVHRRMLQERLSASYRRSVLFRSEAEVAREAERQRIAADFHDGPLQSFISFQMRLEIVRRLLERDARAAYTEVQSLQELCKSQVTELRSFVRSMRPIQADGESLETSIRKVAQHFQKDSGIPVTLSNGDAASPLAPEVSTEILQLVREALHNVQKHAKATRVSLTTTASERLLEITVEDDGSGFPFSGSYTLDELDLLRLGPVSIRRRIRSLSGDLSLDSRPGHGSTLRITVPMS